MKKGFLKKSFDVADLDNQLADLGREGWELSATIAISGNAGVASYGAATAQVVFIFKRKLQNI